MQKGSGDDESENRQQSRRLAKIADLHRHRLRARHDSCLDESDECEEQSDAGSEAVLHRRRYGVGQPRAHTGKRDDEKDNAAHEHCAETLLPRDVKRGETEGDERVLAHVRRDGDGTIRVKTHQQCAESGGENRRHRARARWDSGERENRRIHNDDVRHRDEGGDTSDHFSADIRSALLDGKHAKKDKSGAGPLEPAACCALPLFDLDVVDDLLHAVHAVRGVIDLLTLRRGVHLSVQRDDTAMNIDADVERLAGIGRKNLPLHIRLHRRVIHRRRRDAVDRSARQTEDHQEHREGCEFTSHFNFLLQHRSK